MCNNNDLLLGEEWYLIDLTYVLKTPGVAIMAHNLTDAMYHRGM